MEKYIIGGLVVVSAMYLIIKAFGSWNKKTNCDTCSSQCKMRLGCKDKKTKAK